MENSNQKITLLDEVNSEMRIYCTEDRKEVGRDDATAYRELEYCQLYQQQLVDGLKSKILFWLPLLLQKIAEYDRVIDMYTGGGMIKAAAPYIIKRNAYQKMFNELSDLLTNNEGLRDRVSFTFSTYEISYKVALRDYTDKI
jgi:hypothetical protein